MKKLGLWIGCLSFIFSSSIGAQSAKIFGTIQDQNDEGVIYANVVLHNPIDSSIIKIETTDLDGQFSFNGISAGSYFLKTSFVGYDDLVINAIDFDGASDIELGIHKMASNSVELETAIITAKRPMVEVKADRMVFNVQGTINSVGDNGLELLRKAPGVLVDNNNNIVVLGRNGVLIYVDGKRLPLTGDDLVNYLRTLTASQIDKIDIISNPGAKYEAEGNAGIIDIRLKRNENHGSNGTISTSFAQGKRQRFDINLNGNLRNSIFNTYGMVGYNRGVHLERFDFLDFQNGLLMNRKSDLDLFQKNFSYRLGTDFFISEGQTVGFLINGARADNKGETYSRGLIGRNVTSDYIVDSILIAENNFDTQNYSNTFNINYAYNKEGNTLNVDADYGRYRNSSYYMQPNTYYDPSESQVLTFNNTENDTPVDIDIYTFKVDYETEVLAGRLGVGTKYSEVQTDNSFLFYDVPLQDTVFNNQRSNIFNYDEKVYAGYVQFTKQLTEKWGLSSGLRVEQTNAQGALTAFDNALEEPPVILDYINFFPSLGLSYQVSMGNTFSFNIGRRINRPDYSVLNPFEWQLSEISFSKGSPTLKPEIVNNIELGYTANYKYNFKLSYSLTTDQITRLIAADDRDPRASFISWDNLAEQRILSFNISAPITILEKWNAYFNINAMHQDNQASYADGNTIDLQAFSYNIFQQHTFTLPKGFNAEISSWYNGPGIWGGVFEYDPSWALNFGLQKKFLNDQLNVKLSVTDIFFQSFWSGFSEFGGLRSEGMGTQDNRRGSINLSYNFGNQKVQSRNRKTGLEDESGRVN